MNKNKKIILYGELSKLLYSMGHSNPHEINHIVTKMVEAYHKAVKEARS